MSLHTSSHVQSHVQFGCGLCAPESWLNFDVSPTLRLQQIPFVGRIIPTGPFGRFPANVRYGDIVAGLPLPTAYADLLYCSHVLEHLSLTDLRRALTNCHRLLRPHGIFRLVVPDLETLARRYLAQMGRPDAAPTFMHDTYLGVESRPRTPTAFLRAWLGNSHHLWMWDYPALAAELHQAGFQHIRRAAVGDSGIAAFSAVEDPARWDAAVGIQCQK
jgi:SAM-dependent methyltransferase